MSDTTIIPPEISRQPGPSRPRKRRGIWLAVAAVAIAAGIGTAVAAVASGNHHTTSAGTASPSVSASPRPSASAPATHRADPKAEVVAWLTGTGGTRMNAMMAALEKAQPDQPSTGAALTQASMAATAAPMPASVDPQGHYAAGAAHLAQAGRDITAGNPPSAVANMMRGAQDLNSLKAALTAAGFDTSGMNIPST
jgi:hypothetical protein